SAATSNESSRLFARFASSSSSSSSPSSSQIPPQPTQWSISTSRSSSVIIAPLQTGQSTANLQLTIVSTAENPHFGCFSHPFVEIHCWILQAFGTEVKKTVYICA